jgi:sugar lactone lactonase YvrE
MRSHILYLPLLSLLLTACPKDEAKTDQSAAATSASPATSSSTTGANAPARATAVASAEAPKGPHAAFHTTGFGTPESVLYDADGDRYLVSNINGKPGEADNNGYISAVDKDGKITAEKWIAGGQNKVTLNAPKGSAIAQGVLYVADIDTVRMFDLKTGAPKGDIKVPGATFLNDVTASPDDKIYVSDSGMKQNAKGEFDGTGTDAVYMIEKGKLKTLAKDASLGRPNGLAVGKDGVWVVTNSTGELYRLDDKGKKQDAVKLPKGSPDGIVLVGDTLYISSWEASAIYKGKSNGPFEVAVANVKSPADIGYDMKRNRLLVPLFMENTIEGYDTQ